MINKNYLILNYEYLSHEYLKDAEWHLIPIYVKNCKDIKEIKFNGEIVNFTFSNYITNGDIDLIFINAIPKIGFNSIIMELKNKNYNIGLIEDKNTNISFNCDYFGKKFYNNLIIDLSNLSVTQFNENAFINCSNIISLKSPKQLNYIGDNAFVGCENLSSLVFTCENAPKLGLSVFGYYDLNCTGRNTYSLGVNKLYLLANHFGYDQNDWNNFLLNNTKCGFIVDSHWSYKTL